MPSRHINGGGWIRPTTRLALYLRDGFRCAWCDANLTRHRAVDVTLDHLIPREEGGTHKATNLVTACKSCNVARGLTPWRDWCAIVALRAHGYSAETNPREIPRHVFMAIAGQRDAHVARIDNARRRQPNRDLARAIIRGDSKDPRPAVQAKRTRRANRLTRSA